MVATLLLQRTCALFGGVALLRLVAVAELLRALAFLADTAFLLVATQALLRTAIMAVVTPMVATVIDALRWQFSTDARWLAIGVAGVAGGTLLLVATCLFDACLVDALCRQLATRDRRRPAILLRLALLLFAQFGLTLRRLLLRALALRQLIALALLALALLALRLQALGLRATDLLLTDTLAGGGLALLLFALDFGATLRLLLLLCPLLLLRLLLSLLQLLLCLLLLASLATCLFLALGLRSLHVLARAVLLPCLVLAHLGLPAHLLLGLGLLTTLWRLCRLGARLGTRLLFRGGAISMRISRLFFACVGDAGNTERKRHDERGGP